MKCIISETIIALCNSGLDFSSELSVEGLLGITLDGRDIMLVNIKEVIKSGVTGTKKSSSRTIASDNDSIFSESGVTGAKNSPSRNIDNDSIFSEVTSSDPTTMTVKTLGGTLSSVTVSRNGEQNSTSWASSKMTTQNQTDCFDVPVDSLTLVKSEPVENMEDNVVDSSKQGAVSWNEHCIRESVQQVVSDIDSSYMLSGRAVEEQYCEMNITNTSEQFCELSEPPPDRVSSLPIAHQQNSEYPSIPVCLYTNTSQSQGVPTSSASKTLSQVNTPSYSSSKYQLFNNHAILIAIILLVRQVKYVNLCC